MSELISTRLNSRSVFLREAVLLKKELVEKSNGKITATAKIEF